MCGQIFITSTGAMKSVERVMAGWMTFCPHCNNYHFFFEPGEEKCGYCDRTVILDTEIDSEMSDNDINKNNGGYHGIQGRLNPFR